MREKANAGLVCFLLALVLFISFIVPSALGSNLLNLFEEEEGETYLPVHLMLKQGNELNPREPTEHDLDMPVSVPSGYIADGPWGWLGHTEYRNVGIWKSEAIKYETNVQSTVRYSLWCYWDGGTNEVDLRIGLLVNDVPINSTVQEILGANFEETPQEISLEFMAQNLTLETGDIISMQVEGRVNGNGGKIMFNGPNYRSGVFLSCNSLRIRNAEYDQELNEIRVQVTDAFGLSPYLLNPQLFLDDVLYPVNYHTSYNGDTFFVEILFPLDQWEAYFNGEHTAHIAVSYSPDSETVCKTITFEPKEEETSFASIWKEWVWLVAPILVVILLIVICVVVFKHRRGKKSKINEQR